MHTKCCIAWTEQQALTTCRSADAVLRHFRHQRSKAVAINNAAVLSPQTQHLDSLQIDVCLKQDVHQMLYRLEENSGRSPLAAPANVILRHFRHQRCKAVASNAAVLSPQTQQLDSFKLMFV
jgi:hypothetical protein